MNFVPCPRTLGYENDLLNALKNIQRSMYTDSENDYREV